MTSHPLDEALARLPHGPEFRFLDRLVALDPGRSGTGEYTVRDEQPFLRGHFPDDPLMPGVLLIEAAAQLAGVVAQSDPTIPFLAGLKLTAVRNAKILGPARPGDLLRLQATVTGRLGNLVQAEAQVRSGDAVVLEISLVLAGLG